MIFKLKSYEKLCGHFVLNYMYMYIKKIYIDDRVDIKNK